MSTQRPPTVLYSRKASATHPFQSIQGKVAASGISTFYILLTAKIWIWHSFLPQTTVFPSGSRNVHWIEWTLFLQQFFKPIPQITSYHHFSVSKAEPGVVTLKEYADSNELKLDIFKKGVTVSSLRGQRPLVIQPSGLDPARELYISL